MPSCSILGPTWCQDLPTGSQEEQRWASYARSLLQDVPHVPQDGPRQASDGRFWDKRYLPEQLNRPRKGQN